MGFSVINEGSVKVVKKFMRLIAHKESSHVADVMRYSLETGFGMLYLWDKLNDPECHSVEMEEDRFREAEITGAQLYERWLPKVKIHLSDRAEDKIAEELLGDDNDGSDDDDWKKEHCASHNNELIANAFLNYLKIAQVVDTPGSADFGTKKCALVTLLVLISRHFSKRWSTTNDKHHHSQYRGHMMEKYREAFGSLLNLPCMASIRWGCFFTELLTVKTH
eukprot:TRINITY_DN774_c0_g1_i1.p1 TRINITY_DN774_c0_g1~~TRINITY_DN774_c0_g1_i1.p1  ORF type:complete len:221 (+),score=60.21 TRINITY_DN774_c0_g1_i1:1029-1691(+)